MTSTNGLTNKDFKKLQELLIKANNEQITKMLYIVKEEYKKRGSF